MKIRSISIAAAALSLALTACGSSTDDSTNAIAVADEEAAAERDAPSATSAADDAAADSGGSAGFDPSADGAPDATLPDDIPEAFAPAYHPVEIVGEWLPTYADFQPADDPAVGTAAPVLIGYGLDGQPLRIDPAADGPTMVVYVAHWCPHCNEEVPEIVTMAESGALDDINVVGVMTASDPERDNFPPDQWLADLAWPFPAMFEGVVEAEGPSGAIEQMFAASAAYGVSGYPTVILVDGDGMVTARWSGQLGADAMTEAIDTYLR